MTLAGIDALLRQEITLLKGNLFTLAYLLLFGPSSNNDPLSEDGPMKRVLKKLQSSDQKTEMGSDAIRRRNIKLAQDVLLCAYNMNKETEAQELQILPEQSQSSDHTVVKDNTTISRRTLEFAEYCLSSLYNFNKPIEAGESQKPPEQLKCPSHMILRDSADIRRRTVELAEYGLSRAYNYNRQNEEIVGGAGKAAESKPAMTITETTSSIYQPRNLRSLVTQPRNSIRSAEPQKSLTPIHNPLGMPEVDGSGMPVNLDISVTSSLPKSFLAKKVKILADLSVPVESYDDLSPKGSIDVGIRDLIDEINAYEGFVTTSSCAGRVSVFAEGEKKDGQVIEVENDSVINESINEDGSIPARPRTQLAATGGKGGGGRWLYISHDIMTPDLTRPADIIAYVGMKENTQESGHRLNGNFHEAPRRLVHFKFEPMILHVLTGSSLHAHNILSAALQAGFRESGALNLLPSSQESATPMVAIRSMGLSLESVVGYIDATGQAICCIPHGYLHSLRIISEDRFAENTKRINRFRTLLKETIYQESLDGPSKKNPNGEEWEDANVRRERKKAEGIARAEELRKAKTVSEAIPVSLKEVLEPK